MTGMGSTGTLSHWHLLIEGFQTSALDFYDAVEEAIDARDVPDLFYSRIERRERGIVSAKRTYLRIERRRLAFDICAAPYGNGYFFSWWLFRRRSYSGFAMLLLLIVVLAILSMLINMLATGGAGNESLFGQPSQPSGCALLFIPLVWLIGFPVGLGILGSLIAEGVIGNEEEVLATPVLGRLYHFFFNPDSFYQLDTAAMFQETVRQAVKEVVEDLYEGHGLRSLTEADFTPQKPFLSPQ